MSLRKFLNAVAYIITPTPEGPTFEAVNPERDTWGTSSDAESGLQAMIGLTP